MLRDRILVLPIERKLSDIIEVKNTEKFNLGTVISCGPGKEIAGKVHPMDVKVGDTVRYGEFVFPEYRHNGIVYNIVQEADIAAIVEQEQEVA
jgi:Co-chaperonin GroES (HSP10)